MTLTPLTPTALLLVSESKQYALSVAWEMLLAIEVGDSFDSLDFIRRREAIGKAVAIPVGGVAAQPLSTPDAYKAVSMTYLDVVFADLIAKLTAGDEAAAGRYTLIDQARTILAEYKRREAIMTNPTTRYLMRESARKGLAALWEALDAREMTAHKDWAAKL